MVSVSRTTDVAIIGDGLIGLSTGLELARAGAECVILGTTHPGAASAAAAGLLAPSVGRLPDDVRPFFMDSLDRFPGFLESLRLFDPTLSVIEGLIERGERGELIHPRDGAVDNVRLLAAVRRAVEQSAAINMIADDVAAIDVTAARPSVLTRNGTRLSASRIVLAAGAWSSAIEGLPRQVPVRPLKGQMIALGAAVLRQAIMGDDVYLVPRGNETLAGATVEEAGFDIGVTSDAVRMLRSAAVALCPELENTAVTRSWAGIRPATPDMLPILGADSDTPALLYACGHSKNGILLAPGTAAALTALCLGQAPAVSLEPFRIGRFS